MDIKRLFKNTADLSCAVLVFPAYVFYLIVAGVGRKNGIFSGMSQFFSLFPGLTGSYLRKNFFKRVMSRCAADCAIGFGTIFSHAETELGDGVYIGAFCNIGKCKIQNHCTIGSNVHILSGNRQHNFTDLDVPVQQQGGVFEKIVIGEDSWVGNGAMVMASLGKKCIVGAGSVVTREVSDFAIVAGNPARVIGSRKPGKR